MSGPVLSFGDLIWERVYYINDYAGMLLCNVSENKGNLSSEELNTRVSAVGA